MGGGQEDVVESDDVGVAGELAMVDDLPFYVFVYLHMVMWYGLGCDVVSDEGRGASENNDRGV